MEIAPDTGRAATLYLELLKKCLTRVLFPDRSLHHDLESTSRQNLSDRYEGKDWPTEAETMVGLRRSTTWKRAQSVSSRMTFRAISSKPARGGAELRF
jgi:hypothetical protein